MHSLTHSASSWLSFYFLFFDHVFVKLDFVICGIHFALHNVCAMICPDCFSSA